MVIEGNHLFLIYTNDNYDVLNYRLCLWKVHLAVMQAMQWIDRDTSDSHYYHPLLLRMQWNSSLLLSYVSNRLQRHQNEDLYKERVNTRLN